MQLLLQHCQALLRAIGAEAAKRPWPARHLLCCRRSSEEGRVMPEFEGTSETLSFQEALEDAVRKAYSGYERRTHTDPLFTYVVKRISGHLRTLTVVIEAVPADTPSAKKTPDASAAPPAQNDRAASAAGDPVKELLERQRRNEPLTPNEQALIELLRQDPNTKR
jgi:hypothetical protein